MQKFTCLTCRVSLATTENQRDHYKSEWHIYNLKRKLSQLTPLTEEEYNQVLQKHSNENQNVKITETSFYCDTCCKIFYTEQAFNQHNSSKKHFQLLVTSKKVKKSSEVKSVEIAKNVEKEEETIVDGDAEDFNDSDWEEMESDDEILEGIPLNECLFCSEISKDMEMNLTHMSKVHSFFVPDVQFCIDIKGEFGKQFASKKSAQQHMIDKGHTKIKLEHASETLMEFEDFYDYSSSYPDGEPHDEPEEMNLDGADYQLKLPSGAVIGHRSLFVYYKQNLAPQPAEKKSKNKELLNKVMSQYKALGWTGITGKEAVQKAKAIGHMHRIHQKHQLKLGKRHNLSMQPHLRSQLGFN